MTERDIDAVRSDRLIIASTLSSEPDRTDLVVSALGETQTIIGSFSIGLSPRLVQDDSSVTSAVTEFIEANTELFTGEFTGEWASLHIKDSHDSDEGIRTFEFTQETDGLPYLSSSIVVRIQKDNGFMRSISGDMRQSEYNISQKVRTKQEIIDTLGFHDDEVLLVRGVEPTTMSISWDYVGPYAHIRIDEETLTVYQEQVYGDETVRRTCSIRTNDWHLDDNNMIDDINSLSLLGVVNHSIPCEGDEIWFSSDCTFMLRDNQHNPPISQINDGSLGDGVAEEYTRVLPCSTSNPSFTSTNSNFAEQRKAYAWLTQVVDVAQARLFSQVPVTVSAIELHTDWEDGGTGTARYSDLWKEIYINDNYVTPSTLWHEYGHHVANMYGNFDDTCVAGINEGDAIDECVGAMVAMLTLANLTPNATPAYGAPNSMGIAVNQHDSGTGNVYNLSLCGEGQAIYNTARPFAQAFWEVLSNRNCVLSTCTLTEPAFRATGARLATASENTHEQRIAKSLALALDATPGNTTFANLLTFMNASWRSSFNDEDAARMRGVFSHHGH